MNKTEFNEAIEIAKNMDNDLTEENRGIHIFDRYMDKSFEPVHVTTRQVAALIRWQAHVLDNTWDMEEIDQIGKIGRRKFMIIPQLVP